MERRRKGGSREHPQLRSGKKEAPARETEQKCKIRKRTEAGESFRRKTWSAL